jgi:hypothetical protein
MGMQQNLQVKDIALALELIVYMLNELAEGRHPSPEDQETVRELAAKIKAARV